MIDEKILIERLAKEKKAQEYLLKNARDNVNQKCIHKYACECYELAIDIINELAEETINESSSKS